MCTLSGKSPLPQTFSGCSCDPTYPDYLTTLVVVSHTFGATFLNHLPHSCFAVQMCLGCCFMRTRCHGVGGPRILWILLDPLGSTVRFCAPKSWSQLCRVTERGKSHPCSLQRDLSPLAPQWAGAKVLGLPCCVLRFAGSLPQGYRGQRIFIYLVLLCCFLTREKES